ncbi:MAG: CPBP family intramembrane metalloprotease, partial [Bacteroidetes bacterium]
LVVVLNFFATRSPENLAMYPQLRLREWGWGHVVGSALSWAAYLLAYEFLFRGVLLFGSLPALGPVLAVALNVSLYALVHVPKGAREAFGALPLGLVLCLLTLQSETIWLAFFVHLALAWSNEWFSLWRHPEMRLKA